eukprot:g4781.t1
MLYPPRKTISGSREERNLFFIFTWLLLDPDALPKFARQVFRQRWDAKYANDIGKAWDDMAPDVRGKLCWEGDETIVRQLPGQGVVKMKPPKPGKAALADPKVALNADLTTKIRPGDKIRIGPSDWYEIIGISKQRQKQLGKQPPEGAAFGADPKDPIYWNKNQNKGSLMLNGPAGLPPAAGTFDLSEQVIKAESTTRIAANMVDSFKKHVSAGEDDKWDYSLLTFLLTYSAHAFVSKISAAWKAVAVIRDMRNTFFAHVATCHMSRDRFTTACGRMQTFVRELLGPAAEEEFKKLADAVVREHQFSTTGGGPGGPGHLEGALRSWGATLGVRLDDLGGDIKAMADRLKEHDQKMQQGFEDAEKAAQARHAEAQAKTQAGLTALGLAADARHAETKVGLDQVHGAATELIRRADHNRELEEQRGKAHPLGNNPFLDKMNDKRGLRDDNSYAFTGREWLFMMVAKLLQGNNKGVVIKGGAGIGKSACLAELVANGAAHGLDKHRVVATHFCDKNDVDTLDAKKFATGLLVSFAHSFPGFEAQVYELVAGCETLAQVREVYDDKSADSMLTKVVLPALRKAGKPTGGDEDCCLLCLDSLDEAMLAPGGEDKSIVKLLYSRSVERNWPAWLRIVATSRPQENVLKLLKNIKHIDLAIEDNHKENIEDITKFVAQTVRRDKAKAIVSDEAVASIAAQIAEKSEGMFQYATLVLEDMDDNLSADDLQLRVGGLPTGLYGWYQDRFEALYPQDKIKEFVEEVQPVLAVLLAARAPMPFGLLRQAAGFAGGRKALLVKVLSRISAFCPAGGAMGGRLGGDDAKTYTFVHKSFSDWLQDEEESGDYFVEEGRGEEPLARAAVEMKGRVAQLVPAADGGDGAASGAGAGSVDLAAQYLLEHGLRHAVAAGRAAEAADKILLYFGFLFARAAVGPAQAPWDDARFMVQALEAEARVGSSSSGGGGTKELLRATKLVESALRASIPHLRTQWRQLAGQLVGRLVGYGGRGGGGKESEGGGNSGEESKNDDDAWFVPRIGRLLGETKAGMDEWCGDDGRGWVYPLYRTMEQAGRPLQITLEGHSSRVMSVAWNGKLLASGSADNTIKIWDTESGECVKTLEEHSGWVNSVAWNGKLLASGSHDKTIKIWDAESGACVKTLEGHSDEVMSVAWNGKLLASGFSDNTIKIWDTESGAC